jgi:hypothetical protein
MSEPNIDVIYRELLRRLQRATGMSRGAGFAQLSSLAPAEREPYVLAAEARGNAAKTEITTVDLLEEVERNWRGSPEELERELHGYYLACCRAIWKLLPDETSRRGVELGEAYLAGRASESELSDAIYHVEAAAIGIDIDGPEPILEWVNEVDAISGEELREILHPDGTGHTPSAYDLLVRASYFAVWAMFPSSGGRERVPGEWKLFLSPALLRKQFAGVIGETGTR